MTASASGGSFVHTVRVPYAHTDCMGVVYYAHYLVYFEMARTELLRAAGLPYALLESRGVMLPAVEARCVYRRPARYDDLLAIETRLAGLSGTRLTIAYRILRGDELLAEGHTVHACVDRAGRVIRPPRELRELAGAAPGAAGARPAEEGP